MKAPTPFDIFAAIVFGVLIAKSSFGVAVVVALFAGIYLVARDL